MSRKTFHQIARALITPDEVMRLGSPVKDASDTIVEPGDMLIFVAGHAPIRGTQSLYFRDPVFLERSRISPSAVDKQRQVRRPQPFLLREAN